MRVMVLVKATESSEKGFVRSAETAALMEAMGKFNDELQKAGILRDGDGLKPTSEGRRIAFDGRDHEVGDLLAMIVPGLSIRQFRRDMLAEQAGDMLSIRCQRVVERGGDQHLDHGLAAPAVFTRIEPGAVHVAKRRREDDA